MSQTCGMLRSLATVHWNGGVQPSLGSPPSSLTTSQMTASAPITTKSERELRAARDTAKVWILDRLVHAARKQPLAAEHHVAIAARACAARGPARVRFALGVGSLLLDQRRPSSTEPRGLAATSRVRRADEERPHRLPRLWSYASPSGGARQHGDDA